MRRRIHVSVFMCLHVCLYTVKLHIKYAYRICISNMHIKYIVTLHIEYAYRICISNMHIEYTYEISVTLDPKP